MRHPGRNPRTWKPAAERRLACIACHQPILFGDRCPDCQQRLRQRKRRKPR
jgi:hypothetical protein